MKVLACLKRSRSVRRTDEWYAVRATRSAGTAPVPVARCGYALGGEFGRQIMCSFSSAGRLWYYRTHSWRGLGAWAAHAVSAGRRAIR